MLWTLTDTSNVTSAWAAWGTNDSTNNAALRINLRI
jgi:hypothetical protein